MPRRLPGATVILLGPAKMSGSPPRPGRRQTPATSGRQELRSGIRSTINLVETSFGPTVTGGNQYKKTFLGVANNTQAYGFGQVVPIKITKGGTTFKGAGRFPLIKEVAVMFMARASNQPPLQCTPNGRPVVYDAAHNVISDGSGNILPAFYPVVFAGNAFARLNPHHPWVAGIGP